MAKTKKPFFFRLEPSQLLSALIQIPESERGAWITRVAVELQNGTPVDAFSISLFDEAKAYKQQKSEAGKAGMSNRYGRSNDG
jgi:hypothetical protein